MPFSNCIALGTSDGEQLRHMLSGLCGLPHGTRSEVKVDGLHLSLYRYHEFEKARAKPYFEKTREALHRCAGSQDPISVKPALTPWHPVVPG